MNHCIAVFVNCFQKIGHKRHRQQPKTGKSGGHSMPYVMPYGSSGECDTHEDIVRQRGQPVNQVVVPGLSHGLSQSGVPVITVQRHEAHGQLSGDHPIVPSVCGTGVTRTQLSSELQTYYFPPFCDTQRDDALSSPSPPPYHSIHNTHRTRPPLSEIPVIDTHVSPQSQSSPTVGRSSTPVSTETNGSLSHEFNSQLTGIQEPEGCRHWCTIAYWELRDRVGRLFPVYNNCMNVFAHLPQGDGLWLEQWFSSSPVSSKDPTVRRTRQKIGSGVTISRRADGVWLYNRSDNPVFVNSPTMDPPNTRNLTVYKVFPGLSIKVFDYEIAQNYRRLRSTEPPDGPSDHYAFRISFGKGWGPDYTRQYITSCPCWLEVLLSSPTVKHKLSHVITK